MNDDSSDGGDESEDALDIFRDAVGDLALPLPRVVKRSLWKALAKLITGTVEVPAAKLESVVQRIRDDSAARSVVVAASAQAAADGILADPDLAARTTTHWTARVLGEQVNREAVGRAAVAELRASPPSADADETIDEDWLDVFSRLAEQRSTEDLQRLLGKVLAGEVRSPGTYSLAALQILSVLDQKTAQLFRDFCNISVAHEGLACVITTPYGEAARNGLTLVGFPYRLLCRLQDAGLIQTDLGAWRELPGAFFQLPLDVGGKRLTFVVPDPMKMVRLATIDLTESGYQLRGLLHLTGNEAYEARLVEWVARAYARPAN